MRFKATTWKDDPNDWMVMYLVAEVSGVQRTITGEMVNLGAYGSQMWSGIRGLSGMTQAEAEATAELLNDAAERWHWTGDDQYEAILSGTLFGSVRKHETRQPGDNYWVPRTLEAQAAGQTEWFPESNPESAKVWVMATVAREVAAAIAIA